MAEEANNYTWNSSLSPILKDLANVLFTKEENKLGLAIVGDGRSNMNIILTTELDDDYFKMLKVRRENSLKEVETLNKVISFYEIMNYMIK
jgi:hypothetical protein